MFLEAYEEEFKKLAMLSMSIPNVKFSGNLTKAFGGVGFHPSQTTRGIQTATGQLPAIKPISPSGTPKPSIPPNTPGAKNPTWKQPGMSGTKAVPKITTGFETSTLGRGTL